MNRPTSISTVWSRARADFARMTKPREIEEWLDTYVIRPSGFVFVQLLRNTRVTPNMVSVGAMLAGIGIGLSYYFGHRQLSGAWMGLSMMWLHSALDAADGQLARVTGKTSPIGRIVDGICDNVTFVSIYAALVLAHAVHGGAWPVLALLAAVVAGASHSTHCALTEFQRMLFLNYVYGTHSTVDEQPERLRARLTLSRARGGGIGTWLFDRLLLNYSVQQRAFLPSSDALERQWEVAVAGRPEVRAAFAREYRREMQRLLPYWALLGPNSHKVAIVLSAFVAAAATDGALGALGMLIYLGYDLVVLNAVMGALILVQRRTDRRLSETLAALAADRRAAAG